MRYFITTSIPYTNAEPHIGFLWEVLIADAFVRFQKQQGNDVFFLTGADENGLNIVKLAEEKNIPTQKFVDEKAEKFLQLKEKFNLSFDKFIRTSSEEHKKAVHKFWKLCEEDIYSDYYNGLYCLSCENYYSEEELEGVNCPIHKKPAEKISEKNYFFKLIKYLPEVQKLIESDKIKIEPESKKREVLNIIKSGDIKDLSISRNAERMNGWGIKVPNDNSQIVYVWFDALVNYLSGLGFGLEDENIFENFWENGKIYHFIGKDILKFHAIYWIAMLLSAKSLKLPNHIIVHDFIQNNGQKMSKTLGNVVSPSDLLEKYDIDVIRYYFLKQNQFNEFNFSWDKLENVYNGELKNEIGNLVGRVFGLLKKSKLEKISLNKEILDDEIKETQKIARESFNKSDFNTGIEKAFLLVKRANQFIDANKLWEKGEEKQFAVLILILKELAEIYTPIMPEKSRVILGALSLQNEEIFDNKKIDFSPLF